ncbi:GT2 family glycosyltransferase [Labrenzia sp. EL_126]|nr:GT2 family glycosyltransferase [Labrenzia sp. EL_126]
MIGVIILTFQADDVIEGCLNSLHASEYRDLRVVVCDNNSYDQTVPIVRQWAAANKIDLKEALAQDEVAPANQDSLTLIHTGSNLGFAGGVNVGLAHLLKDPAMNLFWILNPDTEVAPQTAGEFARCAERVGFFSLMGSRIQYREEPHLIQSDGGSVNWWTGICSNINQGGQPEDAEFPDTGKLDFISGANMVASREFVEQAGPMVEDYFLYYEEVDWAQRRGNLPLAWCRDALVFHHGGTTIGSGAVNRRPSPFANYFNFRNRVRFMRQFRPLAVPVTWVTSMLRVVKLTALGARAEAWAAFTGLNGLAPPTKISDRIAPDDRKLAFRPRDRSR